MMTLEKMKKFADKQHDICALKLMAWGVGAGVCIYYMLSNAMDIGEYTSIGNRIDAMISREEDDEE